VIPFPAVAAREFIDAGAPEPVAVFREWLAEAEKTEPSDANAVALATATTEGVPSVRMVLMKGVDARGFAFFTSAQSRKGTELQENPLAAMCFHWKSQRRQVRVEGVVSELPAAEVDEYFHSRARGSQLGAAASEQSRPLESREQLETIVRTLAKEFPAEIPRPDYWRGYVLRPQRIEFWQHGDDRLHDRMLFEREADGWRVTRLFP
jgi:pyridoxamine 5'-phosphate oxidase